MLWLRMRVALLTVAVLGVMGSFVGSADACPLKRCCQAMMGKCSPAPDCCEPCCVPMKKVCCTEYKTEYCEGTRTVYKTAYKDEVYTAYKTECVAEVRTRQVTCYKWVEEIRDEVRTVTKYVPTVEDRVCIKHVWTTKTVTEMVKKTIDKGHFECCLVPRKPTKCEKKADKCLCEKPCYFCEKQVWKPCLVCVEEPCTKCIKVCAEVKEVVKVTVCKPVCVQEHFKVCCKKCVPECKTETYTVMVPKCVAVQCTRKVAVCVPCVEKYTYCKTVPVCVEKWVPCCEKAPKCKKCKKAKCCEPVCHG